MSPSSFAPWALVALLASCEEPCDSACDAPPPSVCVGDDLRTHSAGACRSGECVYPQSDTHCPGGCAEGACLEPCSPIDWTTTLVDEGYDPSLALDGDGGVHISYRSPANGLNYARLRDGDWAREPVGTSANFRNIVSATGNVHIVFVLHRLLLASRSSGGQWSVEPVAGDVHSGIHAVRDAHTDAAGNLHVLYGAGSTSTYKRRNQLGEWQASELVTTATSRSALAVDRNAVPHVVYSPGSAVHYATPRNGTWTSEAAPEPRSPCQEIAVATHAGRIHVACATLGGRGFWHLWREPDGHWTLEEIEHDGRTLSHPTIVVSHRGEPHVAYYDRSNGALRYATRAETGWVIQQIDDTDDGGQNPSLALEPTTGVAHIAYRVDDLERRATIHYARGRACPRVISH